MQHGSPLDHTNRHMGDLGNVYVSGKEAKLNILDSRLKMIDMQEDQEGIIGRAIVVGVLESKSFSKLFKFESFI